MFKSVVLFAPFLIASIASAQTVGCQFSATVPALIRAEGIAERIGDIVVVCPRLGEPGGTVNVVVDLSDLPPSFPVYDPSFVPSPAIVTSRILAPATAGSEPLLLIDDLSSPAALGTNIFQGVQTGASEVTFFNVPTWSASNTRTYRVTNIRVDARDLPGSLVGALTSFGGDLAVVGVKAAGVRFTLQDAAGNPATLNLTLSSLNAALATSAQATGGVLTNKLEFTEGFTQSFRKRNVATSLATPSALADQGAPGTDYHTESGFYLSTLPSAGGLNAAGLATQGTRLVARFANVPAGVALYVTTGALPNTGASSALLTAADASGNGAYSAVAQTTTINVNGTAVGIAPVTLSGGTGSATWEVLDADPAALESYTFGLVVAYAAPQTGAAGVTGELGPLSTVTAADSTSPVPRFADISADTAACAATPCLTATPSAIAISYQTGSPAPAPISLQLASTGSALLFNVAVQANTSGWLGVSPSSGGATPTTLQVTITPASLASGSYRGSIVLTSPTSAFASVTIPVIVTVTGGASGTSPLNCTANNVSVTPMMRQEGITEGIGDIALACSGGTPTAAGTAVPSYDVQLTLTTPITSRTYNDGWSEALLMIDEPNSGLQGSPTNLLACSDSSGTCVITGTGTGMNTYSGTAGRPNVFPGRVSGNIVTFPGIPIDPPGTGSLRTLRITNVRADVSGIAGAPGTVTGAVSVGVVAVTNSMLIVGYVVPGLAVSVRTPDDSAASGGATISQCPSSAPQQAGVLRFSSQFGTAFRPRSSAPYVDSQTSPPPVPQNVPGSASDAVTESMFYAPSLTSPVVDFATVGLATTGTRLRALLANIPAGTRVFVSTLPVTFSGGVPSVATSGAIASLVQNEMLPFLPLSPAVTINGIPAVELTAIDGSASAVWEILLSNTSTNQNLDFLVWVQPLVNSSSPATFTGSYAPAPPAFPDSIGHSASSTLPIPRVAATGTAQNLFSVSGCPAISPAPDLVVTSLTGPINSTPGATVNVSSSVLNQGTASAGPFQVEFYLSLRNNVLLGNAVDTTSGCSTAGLAPGASFICSISVAVPSSLTPGTWYLAALADSNNQVVELDETNNWRISDSGPITVAPLPCSIVLTPATATLPATGTSTPATFYPEVPLTITVSPSVGCLPWTATSSNPAFVQIVSGARGIGAGTVGFTALTNTHTAPRSASITVASGVGSASYSLTEAGSADNQLDREVDALYQQLLGREPDQSGFAFWTGPLGVGLGQMADLFLTSPEAFGSDFAVMAAYQAALGTPPTYAQYTGALTGIRAGTQTVGGLFASLIGANYTAANLYQNLLNRQPLASEITSANAVGLASWLQTLIGSPEFQSTGTYLADHSNVLYIRMLYFVILGRDPDAGGFNFWVGIANGGGPGILFRGTAGAGSRLAILGLGTPNEGFIGSPEFQGLFAN